MFALLALAGDVGCSGGPTLAGMVSSAFENDLKIGILAAIIFPVLMFMALKVTSKGKEQLKENKYKKTLYKNKK